MSKVRDGQAKKTPPGGPAEGGGGAKGSSHFGDFLGDFAGIFTKGLSELQRDICRRVAKLRLRPRNIDLNVLIEQRFYNVRDCFIHTPQYNRGDVCCTS